MQDTFDETKKLLKQILNDLSTLSLEYLRGRGIEGMNIIMVPTFGEVDLDEVTSAISSIISALINNREFLVVSSDFEGFNSLLESLEEVSIKNEEYENINQIRRIRKNFKSNKTTYLGSIKI